MTLSVLAALVAVGLLVGFVSGLIGIGGGVLIVPFLYFFYAHASWSGAAVAPELEAAVAHATSLAVIVPTGLRGAWSGHKRDMVAWKAALPIALAAVLAAVVGARLALILPPQVLKAAFGLLLVAAGANLFLEGRADSDGVLKLDTWRVVVTGVAVGLFSALLGVGGGIIAIPLLLYLVHLDLRRVAATSLAVIALTALAGATTYALSGIDTAGRPEGSLGFVHVAAAVPMLVGSVLSVPLGAWVNRRMPLRALRWMFGVVFVVLGARLLWQNLL